ncbi:MAG: molecular chaperone SurA, partial [Comamonas sp.]
MRFFSQTSSACTVAAALVMLAAGAQAQGLKNSYSAKPGNSDASVSRALGATAQPSGRQAPATAGVRSAD